MVPTPTKLSACVNIGMLNILCIYSYMPVPDKINLSLYVGGVVSISIPSDPPIAGESYTLECSAGGSEGTFQWLGPPDGSTPVATSDSITIAFTSIASQLQFRPIQPSDNGSYICNASIDGLAIIMEPVITIVAKWYSNQACKITLM